jgi:hypothetical protein
VDLAIEHSRGSDSALEADLWDELCRRLERIGRDDLIAQQQTLARISGRSPKGGQRALNELLARTFPADGWLHDSRVFRPRPALPSWRLSFLQDRVGVVVCTQNVGYLAQKLLTLQIAAGRETESRWPPSAVDVGVLLVPTEELKTWSRMDSSVTTYRDALAQNVGLESVLSAPIAIVGLDARTDGTVWEPTKVFPGGSKAP